jgi:hypothetical protein
VAVAEEEEVAEEVCVAVAVAVAVMVAVALAEEVAEEVSVAVAVAVMVAVAVAEEVGEDVALALAVAEAVEVLEPVEVAEPVAVLVAVAEEVAVLVAVLVADPQPDREGVFELVVEAVWLADTVLVFEPVVVELPDTVLVGDTEGEGEALLGNEGVAWLVEDTEGEGLALALAKGEAEVLPVAAPELETLGEPVTGPVAVAEERPEKVRVTLTVKVTPVGKVDWDTVGVPPRGAEAVIVGETRGVWELEEDRETVPVGVFVLVEEEECEGARMAGAVPCPPAPTIVPVTVTLELWDLLGGLVRVLVTDTVDVLEEEALPVIVVDMEADLLACAEAVTAAVLVRMAVGDTEVVEEGVAGAFRVTVPVMVTEGLSLLALAVMQAVAEEVFEAVEDRDMEALPVGVKVNQRLAVREGEILAERVGMRMEALALGEEEGVFELARLPVLVTETVGVLLRGGVAVMVFDTMPVRLPVADTEGDLEAVMVRVPLGDPVPVFEDVVVPVVVMEVLMVPDSLGVQEGEGEPEEVFVEVMVRVPLGEPLGDLVGRVDLEYVGVVVDVFVLDTDPVLVLDLAALPDSTAVPVVVLEAAREEDRRAEAVAVLEVEVVLVELMDSVVVFVVVEEGEGGREAVLCCLAWSTEID